ncbi:hypothetical protein [Streptomyces canus]|uniref:hypothetical protein n=1 Tax=Streptomyces canus TaxID=58343 RepID=UPI0033A2ABFF
MDITDSTAQLLTLTADQLDAHSVGGHDTPRPISIGLVRNAIAAASDTLLRRNRLVGGPGIDAARIGVYQLLPDTTGTVAEYADQLRALATPDSTAPDEGEHEECLGIHDSADGYRDCGGNLI